MPSFWENRYISVNAGVDWPSLDYPNGIAADEDGHVLVTDQNCIEFKFLIASVSNLYGVLVRSVQSDTSLTSPRGVVCVDLLNGQIAVVDQMHKRVVCF